MLWALFPTHLMHSNKCARSDKKMRTLQKMNIFGLKTDISHLYDMDDYVSFVVLYQQNILSRNECPL